MIKCVFFSILCSPLFVGCFSGNGWRCCDIELLFIEYANYILMLVYASWNEAYWLYIIMLILNLNYSLYIFSKIVPLISIWSLFDRCKLRYLLSRWLETLSFLTILFIINTDRNIINYGFIKKSYYYFNRYKHASVYNLAPRRPLYHIRGWPIDPICYCQGRHLLRKSSEAEIRT